jgi:hypothetical protein
MASQLSNDDSSDEIINLATKKRKLKASKAKSKQKEIAHKEFYNVQKLLYLMLKKPDVFHDITEYRSMISDLDCSTQSWPYGSQKVVYSRGKINFGRLVPHQLGYIRMSRVVRHTVSDMMYADIDFVNCHMYILKYLCERYDIPAFRYEIIDMYIKNRRSIIDDALQENNKSADEIKQWFLAVMNGMDGIDPLYNLTAFMMRFATDAQELKKLLVVQLEKENKYAMCRSFILTRDGANVQNIESKIISLVLLDHEDRMREALSQYVVNNGFDWSVECYDGGMSYAKKNPRIIESALNLISASDYVKQQTGIECVLSFKNLTDQAVSITDAELNTITFEDFRLFTLEDSQSYEAVKYRFEKYNFFSARDVLYYTENPSSIQFHSDHEFQNKYKHISYVGLDKKGNEVVKMFVPDWMKDPAKRQYEIVGFFPPGFTEYETNINNSPNWIYSTWKGFAAERIKPDGRDHSSGVKLMRDHILYLCNEDESYRRYIEKYMKHMLIYPGKKTDVVLAFKAVQGGEGKNTFFEIMKNVIGSDYCVTSGNHERDWFGDFNEVIHNKLWIHMEEMSKDVLRKHQKQFLAYVTSKTDTINLKGGKKIRGAPSFCNYFITFNSQGVEYFPGLRRRLWVHELTNPVKNTEYYNQLYAAMNDPQCIRALYDYLLTYVDISFFKASGEDVPMTPYMMKLWGNEDSPKDRFDTFMHSCFLEWFQDNIHPASFRISLTDWFDLYNQKCKADGVSANFIGVIQNFSKRIDILFPEHHHVISKSMSKGRVWFKMDIDSGMKYLIEEKKWLEWTDLGWEDEYDKVTYKVHIPCLKKCQSRHDKQNNIYHMSEPGRAIQHLSRSHEVVLEYKCICGGHYSVFKTE